MRHATLEWVLGLKGAELDFAPEILQIQDRPPSPLPRLVLQILTALFAVALVWAAFGRLDIIAVAQGKLVPQSYLQIVQPADASIVKEILVRDGDAVKAGQVLVRLDPKISEAELMQLRNDLNLRSLQLHRIDAELAGSPFVRRSGDPRTMFAQVEAQHRDRRQAYLDALGTERAALAKAEQDLKSAIETEAKLKKTVPIYQEQEAAFVKLNKDGFAGRLMMLDKQRDRVEKEQDLRSQEYNIASLKAMIDQSNKRIAQITSNYRQTLQNERMDAEGQHLKLQQDWEKQTHRHELLELKAPQDGIVKDLATRTVGSVLAAGTVVMTLVPSNDVVHAEVWVTSQDAGFVHTGQPVKLKFAAYSFQKYGMVEGEVKHLSPDSSELPQAQNLEKKKADQEHVPAPTGFRTLVALKTPHLVTDGVRYPVTPGMQVTAEIHLGTRTVLEYLLSPVQKVTHEAGREK
jgi:HlyD family secretion protein